LPLLMGVDVRPAETLPEVRSEPAHEFRFRPPERSHGLAAADTDSWIALKRLFAEGRAVWRDPLSGDFITAADAAGRLRPIERPRIGVYKSFVPAPDEGWTRWLMEQYGFPFASVRNPEILAGGLRARFDVLVFPDQAAEDIADGFRAGAMPAGFTGGLRDKGEAALRRFAEDGGTLVFLNRAARYAVNALSLRLTDVTAGVPEQRFYCPGSLLAARVDGGGWLTQGAAPELAIWSEHSPAWDLPDGSPGRVVLRYPESGVLASGWLLGERVIAGKAALIDYPLGRGRAILFGLRPQYRGQRFATFKLFFNALLAPGA
jgi:hypothetical protein